MNIFFASKRQALSRGHIGCVGEIQTLNVARGCAGSCVFCYARSYSGAPESGNLLVYPELPNQLRRELDSLRRKNPLPPYVVFSTATDSFLGGPQVVQISRACLEILLNRGVGISLSTRGLIPEDVLAVLARHAPHVQITVPLVSLSEEYTATWEPGTATPRERLFLLQRLRELGIAPQLRIEPLIPFVNDHTEQLREVVSAAVGVGLTEASAGFLHLRPGVEEQLQREAPAELRRLVLGIFPRPDERRSAYLHLSTRERLRGLRRLQRVGREHGLRVSACHCQNPGLPAGRCPVAPREIPQPKGEQRQLF